MGRNPQPIARELQRGFTALETSIAICVGLMLVAAAAYAAMGALHNAQLANAIASCRVAADAAERFRKTASASSVDASDVYSYTYNGFPTWTNVAAFNAAAGTNLRTNTVWGSPFQIIGGTQAAQCSFTAPFDLGGNPTDGIRTSPSAGVFQYTVYAPRAEDNDTSKRLRQLKAQFYEENTR